MSRRPGSAVEREVVDGERQAGVDVVEMDVDLAARAPRQVDADGELVGAISVVDQHRPSLAKMGSID